MAINGHSVLYDTALWLNSNRTFSEMNRFLSSIPTYKSGTILRVYLEKDLAFITAPKIISRGLRTQCFVDMNEDFLVIGYLKLDLVPMELVS